MPLVVPDERAAKRVLRVRLRLARRLFAARPADGALLAEQLLSMPELAGARVVACYVSGRHEPSTDVLLQRLSAAGVRVLLPVVLADLDLDWALDDGTRHRGVGPGALEPGGERLGRAAVGDADVVVVPALAVDPSGGRLGQGGGSYDRALARARPRALVVALLHDAELLAEPVPVLAHDRRVDAVATPRRVVRFTAPARAAARPD